MAELTACLGAHRKAVVDAEEIIRMHADVVRLMEDLVEMGCGQGGNSIENQIGLSFGLEVVA